MDTIISSSPEQTFALGAAWAHELGPEWLLGFSGDLGVGKTKLIQGFCHGWGVSSRVASPTYSLVHAYASDRGRIHHLDLYRLEGEEALWDAGCVDYLAGDAEGCVLVEWIDRGLGTFQHYLCRPDPFENPFVGCLSLHPPRQKGRYSLKILAIEWSQRQRSLALGELTSEKGLECLASVILEGIHDAALWDAFERWSEDFQLDAAEIQKVVVGLGPGSHAGVRHAIAAAYGWHLAKGCELLGLSSALVLACQAMDQRGWESIHVAIDAQRSEAALLSFTKGQKEGSIDQEGLTRFGPLESFKEAAACGGIVASQEMVDRLRSIGVADDQLLPAYPEASWLMKVAIEQPSTVRKGPILEPLYLRKASFVKAPPITAVLPLSEVSPDREP